MVIKDWVLKSSCLCSCLFYHCYFESCCTWPGLSSGSFKVCQSFRKFCTSALQYFWAIAVWCLLPLLPRVLVPVLFIAVCSCPLGVCTLHKVLGFRLLPWSCFFAGIIPHVLVFRYFARNICARFHLYSFGFYIGNLEVSFIVIVDSNMTC